MAGSSTDVVEPIRIVGIVEEKVGVPRNDGTQGSALYAVPIRLSREPSAEWANLFVQTWDRPPRFTLMHRPGIAHVIGDQIILDGTTLEEVEQHHKDTLKLVVEQVNDRAREIEAQAWRRREAGREKLAAHSDHVADMCRCIKFD